MQFGAGDETALRTATALVNTLSGANDALTSTGQLIDLLDDEGYVGYRAGSAAELDDVRALRGPLGRIWRAREAATVAQLCNRLLRGAQALPQLRSDPAGWQIHVTARSAPLAQRIAAESALGFIALVQADDLARLKHCAATGCRAVLLDLSRNRSRRFCDTGNCGNREHVAAYRARKLMSVSGTRS
jgi:predicted RNA-binding Zn ribbon-like protein